MPEDVLEFGDPVTKIHAPTQQELKIFKFIADYDTCYLNKVAHMNERDEERRKWKEYRRNYRKYRDGMFKATFSKA